MNAHIKELARELVARYYDGPSTFVEEFAAEVEDELKLLLNKFAWKNEIPIPYPEVEE